MRYEFSGSVEEIERFLVNECNYSQRAAQIGAKFFVYERLDDKKGIENIELSDDTKFLTPVFNSRFDISLTDAKTELVNNVIEALIGFCITKEISSIPIWFFSSLSKMIKYISDECCCVYFAAIKWKLKPGNSVKRFEVDDLMDIIESNESYCVHIEDIKAEKFPCEFYKDEKCNLCGHEECKDYVKKRLDDLCEKKVLQDINGTYEFLV